LIQVEEANLSFFRFIKERKAENVKKKEVTETAFGQSPSYFIVEK